jgi:hypothetical protein
MLDLSTGRYTRSHVLFLSIAPILHSLHETTVLLSLLLENM